MKSIFFAILLAISVLLLGLTSHGYVQSQEMNQTQYCHNHFANGTALCHMMPMNITMQVSSSEIEKRLEILNQTHLKFQIHPFRYNNQLNPDYGNSDYVNNYSTLKS